MFCSVVRHEMIEFNVSSFISLLLSLRIFPRFNYFLRSAMDLFV